MDDDPIHDENCRVLGGDSPNNTGLKQKLNFKKLQKIEAQTLRPFDVIFNSSDAQGEPFNHGLWGSTIGSMVVAMSWGIVAVSFAAFNAYTRPIEVITGPMGLYVWNSCAG